MKILSWLVGLPLAVVVVVFALSNRHPAMIALWPFDRGLELPVYLAVLLPLVIGFLGGFLWASGRGLKHRRAARVHAKRADSLQREIDDMRAAPPPSPAAAVPPADPKVPT